MHESAESRSAAVRAVLLRFYPHQYPWGESCAPTVSLLLRFSEAAHDGQVRNRISDLTIVCRLRESPARAHSSCTSLHFHSMDLAVQTYILLFSSGSGRRRVTTAWSDGQCRVPRLRVFCQCQIKKLSLSSVCVTLRSSHTHTQAHKTPPALKWTGE